MSMNQGPGPSPAWYPDPSGHHQLRYWDGQGWTGHISQHGQTGFDQPAAPQPAHYQQAPPQPATYQQAPPQAAPPQPAAPQPAHYQQAPPQPDFMPTNWQAGARLGTPWSTGRWSIPGHTGLSDSTRMARSLRRPLSGRILQITAVYLVVGLLLGGGWAVNRLLAGDVGPPVAVSDSVTVQPLSGWRTAPQDDGGLLLTRGSGSMIVRSESARGSDADAAGNAATDYVNDELGSSVQGRLGVSDIEETWLADGVRGVRLQYEGEFTSSRHNGFSRGEVIAVVTPSGDVAIFDAWARPDVLRFQQSEVQQMIETARFS